MTIAFVQSAADDGPGFGTVTFGGNVVNGNVIVCGLLWLPTSISLTSITSDRSGSFTLVDNPTTEADNPFLGAMGVVAVTSSGSMTLTGNWSGTLTAIGFACAEYSGVDVANIIDNAGAAHNLLKPAIPGPGGVTDGYASGTITTATDNAMLVGFGIDLNENDDLTKGTGFTDRIATQVGSRMDLEEKLISPAGATAVTFTCPSDFRAILVGGVALKPSAPPAPPLADNRWVRLKTILQ